MLENLCTIIDKINEWVGKIGCWLILPLTLLVTLEVLLRYIFNSPTIWIWDVNVQILGLIIVLGGGYAFVHDAHIGVDVIAGRLPERKKAFIDCITYALFLFTMGIIVWEIITAAWVSAETKERYSSYLMPPIYPFKIITAIAVILLYLQGIAKFIRSLVALFTNLPQHNRR
jgi:TRAP-type mannitol/chloroaromatic compound transport system permease small subunit